MPGKFSNLSRWSFYAESHRNAVLSGNKKRSSNLWLNYCSDRFLRKLGRWVLNLFFLSFTLVPQICARGTNNYRNYVRSCSIRINCLGPNSLCCRLFWPRLSVVWRFLGPLQCALNRRFFGLTRRKSNCLVSVQQHFHGQVNFQIDLTEMSLTNLSSNTAD